MFQMGQIDFGRFFTLDDPLASRPFRLDSGDESGNKTIKFEWQKYQEHKIPEKPIKLKAFMGGQINDILWSGPTFVFCISTRLRDILEKNQISGWTTYAVEVFGRKGEFLPGYHGFIVTGNFCNRDRSRSQILTRQAVPNGKPYQVYKGLYFKESEWDGSDFFLVHGIVVTEKVKILFSKEKITNIRFTSLTEVELDVNLDKYKNTP